MEAPERKALDTKDYLLMLVAVLIMIGVGIYYVISAPPFLTLGITAASKGIENVKVTIIHRGGDNVPASELKVYATNENDNLIELTMAWPDNLFSLGDEGVSDYCYGASSGGKTIGVRMVHSPTGKILYENDNIMIGIGG